MAQHGREVADAARARYGCGTEGEVVELMWRRLQPQAAHPLQQLRPVEGELADGVAGQHRVRREVGFEAWRVPGIAVQDILVRVEQQRVRVRRQLRHGLVERGGREPVARREHTGQCASADRERLAEHGRARGASLRVEQADARLLLGKSRQHLARPWRKQADGQGQLPIQVGLLAQAIGGAHRRLGTGVAGEHRHRDAGTGEGRQPRQHRGIGAVVLLGP